MSTSQTIINRDFGQNFTAMYGLKQHVTCLYMQHTRHSNCMTISCIQKKRNKGDSKCSEKKIKIH